MKILHVIPSVSPQRGGPSFTLQTMAKALNRAGLDVHIATTDDDGSGRLRVPLGQPVAQEGVTYWYFPRQTRFYTASWPLTRWLARHMQDYDLVHIHALFSYAALPAAFFAARQGVLYIVRPLGTLNRYGIQRRRPWLKRLSFQLIERHILQKAALIHYTSEQERIEAMELGITRRSVIIPNPVELPRVDQLWTKDQFRQQYPCLLDRTIILFFSRLDPKKGLDLLLPAFAQVRTQYPQVALVLAGSGEPTFVEGLRKQAEKLGIATDIVWTGFLEGAAKQAVLNDADIFVLPSYSENFGNVVIEAMAFGLPVIISDQVGVHDRVTETSVGIVIPCNIDILAEALLDLVGAPTMRQQMGAAGRSLVQRDFSIQSITQRLNSLYITINANTGDYRYAR